MNQRFVQVDPTVRLWSEVRGAPRDSTLLLIMGAGASGLGWPEGLVDALAVRHHVIRYDHRDTGRSSLSFDTHPYRIVDLASDAIAVLDGYEVERAHIVGHSLGGMLTQLLIADHPERLLSATVMGTGALSSTPLAHPDGSRTPVDRLRPIRRTGCSNCGPTPTRTVAWRAAGPPRGALAAAQRRSDPLRLRGVPGLGAPHHRRRRALRGAHDPRHADRSGINRTEELRHTEVPTLVVYHPADLFHHRLPTISPK